MLTKFEPNALRTRTSSTSYSVSTDDEEGDIHTIHKEQIHDHKHVTPKRRRQTQYELVNSMDETDTPTLGQGTSNFGSYHYLYYQMIHDLMNITERNFFYLSLFFTVCCSLLRLLFFIFMSSIIDLLNGTYSGKLHVLCPINCDSNQTLIYVLIICCAILCIVVALIDYIKSRLCSNLSSSFLKRLNCSVFDAIIGQNVCFFDLKGKRELRHLLTKDMKHIRYCIYKLIIIIESVMQFMFALAYIFIANWHIALMIVASFVFLFVASVIYIRKSSEISNQRKLAFKIVLNGLAEMLNYITTIKIFSKESDESYIYEQNIDTAFNYHTKSEKYLYAYQLCMKLIWYFACLCIIWYGAYLILDTQNKHITLGVLVIDLFLFLQLNFSVYQIVTLSTLVIVNGSQSIARVIHILETNTVYTNESQSKTKGNECEYIPENDDITGLIEIRDIDFAYPNFKKKWVLNDICLRFEPCTTTALVGVSGSGKSTIFKLIMRLIDYDTQLKGQILIDNIEINQYNLAFLHARIGYVGQYTHLFENRSVSDNIKFGISPDLRNECNFDSEHFNEEAMYLWRKFKSITRKDVENAAKIANAHGFIMNLKDGYETLIGGRKGIRLSAGEQQRIAIARAVLLDPKVLLLDEAMSSVDPISALLIKNSLDAIMKNRCVVVIAHRLKTVKNANKIYVINEGRIIQSGKHDELIQIEDGYYAQFVQQFS